MLLLMASVAIGATTCNRDRILACAFQYVDSDANGVINATEINSFMVRQPCGLITTIVSGESFMTSCDRNKDGVFTVADYDAPLTCFQSNSIRQTVCRHCDKCDVVFSKKKK